MNMRFQDEKKTSSLAETSLTNDKPKGLQFDLVYGDREVVHLDGMCSGIKEIWFFKSKRCKPDGSLCPEEATSSKSDDSTCPKSEKRAPYHGKCFRTTDAFVRGKDEKFYFIEFKNQRGNNIEWEELLGKAIESLFCVSLSVLHKVPMEEIRRKSIFILVYKKDPIADAEGKKKMMGIVNFPANRIDSSGETKRFDIDVLQRDFQLYSEVHTFSEEEFNAYCSQIFQPPPPAIE